MNTPVQCPRCKRIEYYGHMHWTRGGSVCRRCIYDEWEHDGYWRRGATDLVYPDGRFDK